MDNLEVFFEDIKGQVKPSVLHGDLWSGNIGAVDGEPTIFDPAVYYGHSEAEFGMSWCAGEAGQAWGGGGAQQEWCGVGMRPLTPERQQLWGTLPTPPLLLLLWRWPPHDASASGFLSMFFPHPMLVALAPAMCSTRLQASRTPSGAATFLSCPKRPCLTSAGPSTNCTTT